MYMNARAGVGRLRYIGGVVVVPVALYLLAAGLLLFDLNRHPNFTYNWENNTLRGLYPFVEQPSLAPFKLLEGLMTDSGQSPWVVLPAWAGFGLGGPSLLWLRVPGALISALAVPLAYFVGRRTVDDGRWGGAIANYELRITNYAMHRLPSTVYRLPSTVVPIVSALLLALSPVYLLYGRTATVVGVSLVPALLTVLALMGVLRRPDLWWRPVALLGTLALGAYGYAPLRFLWPMCVGLLLLEAFMSRKERARKRRLVASAALLVVAMAAFITALDFDHGHDLVTSVGYYYAGRGEHIASLLANAEEYERLVGADGQKIAPPVDHMAWGLLAKNVADMANLFLDRETAPALTDFWNPHGRLIPWWLMPLLVVGLLVAGWRGLRRGAYRWRVLVLVFLGFTVPMLLTSQVHIGRLIFAVPFICLLAAFGLSTIADCGLRIADFFARRREGRTSRPDHPPSTVYRISSFVPAVVLVAAVAWSTWKDYTIVVPPTYEAAVTRILRARVGEVAARGGGLALVTGTDERLTLEEIDSQQYRLMLRDFYHFYNLATGDVDVRRPGDTRPALYIGGLMDRLKEPEKVPQYCENIYYVAPDLLEKFEELIESHIEMCPEPVLYKTLP
jgi:hypothetical protein